MVYRVVGWILNFCAVLALAVGASFFSELKAELKDLNKNMGELKTTLAVTRERESAVSGQIGELKAAVDSLKADVISLKLDAAARKAH